MLDFLANNWGSLLVGVILLGIIVLVVVKLVRDRKKGKACNCGCEHCSNSAACREDHK